MPKNHLNHISSLIILTCLLATITITASACASVEQATNSVKNKASEVMSQLNSSSNNTSTLTPPSSSYPADIIGSVTISKSVIGQNMPQTLKGEEFWIVQTAIRNKTYQNPIDDRPVWYFRGITSSLVNSSHVIIPQGQTSEMILCFMVDAGLNPNNYQICYGGQIPVSYGNLVNTGTVAEVYDWDLKKVINKPTPNISTRGIATVESMFPYIYGLDVIIKPQNAKVNTTYLIQLYENGEVRQEGILTWTQPEINVKSTKLLRFNLKEGEYDSYWKAAIANANWWKDIFSINIEERN
jgi:hypothetical protein